MAKNILRKKFIFALIALTVGTLVTIYLRYEGVIYVQIFGIVVTGFLVSQAYVDSKLKED